MFDGLVGTIPPHSYMSEVCSNNLNGLHFYKIIDRRARAVEGGASAGRLCCRGIDFLSGWIRELTVPSFR